MRRLLSLSFIVVALLLDACGDPVPAGPTIVVGVTILDDSLTLDQTTASTGVITFGITNQGNQVHEFEIFATDKSELEVVQNVADTSGLDQVDEIEDIIPGATVTLDVQLDPGHYLILSNYPGEYAAGMAAELTVTD